MIEIESRWLKDVHKFIANLQLILHLIRVILSQHVHAISR